ncbi:hypothetical protein ACFL51_02280 [Myxococcota bacterium]
MTCSDHGTCVVKGGEPVCACHGGYAPDSRTGLSCLPISAASTAQPSTSAGPRRIGGYRFSREQVKDLMEAGCLFDSKDGIIAQRLRLRGFSAQDYVGAYRVYAYYKKNYKEFATLSRKHIETIAISRSIKISDRMKWYFIYEADRGRNLTAYYNSNIIKGKGMLAGGIVLLVVGLAGGIASAIVASNLYQSYASCFDSDCDDEENSYRAGIVGAAAGGVLVIIGVVLVGVGAAKLSRWLKPGTLEDGRKEALDKVSGGPSTGSEDKVQFSLTPYVGSARGGLGLTLRF